MKKELLKKEDVLAALQQNDIWQGRDWPNIEHLAGCIMARQEDSE